MTQNEDPLGSNQVASSVTAVICRRDGTVERLSLDPAAYAEGRIEPTFTVANGESFSFQSEYA